MYKNSTIIAEVKTQSPFGFKSEKTWDELLAVANKIGDIISIHTDSRWGGSFDLIKKSKSLTDKPILAKGIHTTDAEIDQAIAAGADYCLVVGRIPKIHIEKCLIEPNNLADLVEIIKQIENKKLPHDLKIVWNSRDLETGGLKKETFADARKIFDGWMCQASNIKTFQDINESADAVLIGENLIEFSKSID